MIELLNWYLKNVETNCSIVHCKANVQRASIDRNFQTRMENVKIKRDSTCSNRVTLQQTKNNISIFRYFELKIL